MHIRKRGIISDAKNTTHITKINKVGIIGFFSAFGLSLISTIWAIYFESILHNASLVGFLTSAFIIVGTLTYVYSIPFLEKNKKFLGYTLILFLMVLSYALFTFVSNVVAIIILGFLVAILGSLRVSLYGIIVRDVSKDKEVSKNEGFIYTLLNVAWFIAPIIAGYIASELGMKIVFLVAAIMFFITLLLVKIFGIKDERTTKKIDKKPFKVFLDYFKNKNRVFAYLLGGGIDFWWVLIYIYVPIFLFDYGLDEATIGVFLGAVILPLVLIEYKIGKIANIKGFKKIFLIGFLILGVASLSCFFITNIYVILAILVLSSIGAAMIEPTSEAYFFDVIKKNERDKFYPIYNTTINTSSIVARILAALILLILPFNYIYLLFAVVMFCVAYFSTRAKNIIEAKKI